MNRALIASALAAAITLPGAVAMQAGPTATPTYACRECATASPRPAPMTAPRRPDRIPAPACPRSTRDPTEWVYVPAGYCDRIVGGHAEAMAM